MMLKQTLLVKKNLFPNSQNLGTMEIAARKKEKKKEPLLRPNVESPEGTHS